MMVPGDVVSAAGWAQIHGSSYPTLYCSVGPDCLCPPGHCPAGLAHECRLPRGALDEVPAKVLAEQLGLGGERKIGTAKAKPRPVRPGGKKPGAGKGWAKRRTGTAGKDATKHAHRRRPS